MFPEPSYRYVANLLSSFLPLIAGFALSCPAFAGAGGAVEHLEYVRYGKNNPDSPVKRILAQAEWVRPLLGPAYFALPSDSSYTFVTRSTLYLDDETIEQLAPHIDGDFATLMDQDMSSAEGHPGLDGAPILVCLYAPKNRSWGLPTTIPSDVPLETALAHAPDILFNLFWNIIDHPPYSDIPSHPLQKIGSFRVVCPGEAASPFVRQYERFIRGTAEYVLKWGFQMAAPIRGFNRAPPSIPISVGLQFGVAITKSYPDVYKAHGSKEYPRSDPPPSLLRYNMTSVSYRTPGSTGLVEMDIVPLQFLLTESFSQLPGSLREKVTPAMVAIARRQNSQQTYQICSYRQGRTAYWVNSDPFKLESGRLKVNPSKGSPERPGFACPLEPPNLWR